MKRFLTIFICFAMIFSLGTTAFAEGNIYSDVSESDWYADSVATLREKGIMDGVGDNRFDPDGIFTRAQLATVLYRLTDRPAVQGEDEFSDTENGTWYSNAVLWASQNSIVNGYGNGLFGTNDATTQQQLTVMLWRKAGARVLDREKYASAEGIENQASDWAFDAVVWAKAEGLIADLDTYAPKDPATRAQVADMVCRYLQRVETDAEPLTESNGSKILVAYFSCTGNTEKIANFIAGDLGAATYRITPETPYTSEDLNYNDDTARATLEQNDSDARPDISGGVANMKNYDVIFIGYPIWWGQAPKIMYTFVESYDFSGKTVIPFCTSGSSSIGSSASNLSFSAPEALWLNGNRFSGNASHESVTEWVDGLGITAEKD